MRNEREPDEKKQARKYRMVTKTKETGTRRGGGKKWRTSFLVSCWSGEKTRTNIIDLKLNPASRVAP